MIALGIDTALDACSVALVGNGVTLAALSEPMSRGQAERLAPMAREVVAGAGLSFAAVERIAVTKGPGSFTGVRVGLSFARALALALNKPCLGVSTLEALALQDGESGLRAGVVETPGACYAALYEAGRALFAPRCVERADYRALLARAAGGRDFSINQPGAVPDAAMLARRASRLDPAGYPPAPLYLRAPHVTAPRS